MTTQAAQATQSVQVVEVVYETAVCTPAGWRSETVTALAEKISAKRVRVTEVVDVGGNGDSGYASRTGANRQRYSVTGVAVREAGKVKNISALSSISAA